MEFCLLGPLVVRRDGVALAVPGGKPRAVLAALLLDAGHLMTAGQLTEVLWGADPPPSARVTLQNHVKRLRRALGPDGGALIATKPGGYAIQIGAGELDVTRFRASVAQARAAARDGLWEQASGRASAALLLWRGEPLADVDSELLVQRALPHLAESRLQAWETRLMAEIQLGRPGDAIVELQRLVAEHPLREQLHALLLLALQRCGRRAEALTAYQAARRIFIDELGAEPGPELQEAHQRLLAHDRDAVTPPPAVGPRPQVIPRQLPAPVGDFVGRDAELAALASLLDRVVISDPATMVVSVIGGMGGIGKTALTVHWAHQVASHFPDGQLYVNLRGFGPSATPVSPATAIRTFLDALEVPAARIPARPDAQAALYRSLLSGKRMLVLLDNARDADQVRPLLPGSPGCLALVTSRIRLIGLAATEGAHQLDLGLLSQAEARELLARRLDPTRLGAEPEAAAELIRLCGRLPLALAIAAARASAHPTFPLGVFVQEVGDAQRVLDALETGEGSSSARAVFSWSLRAMSPPAARMFRLLGLHPGPDITAAAAASLAGIPPSAARQALAELVEAHLVTEHVPGRFSLHDLLHAYAAEQVSHDRDQLAAVRRALDYYLHAAHAADRVMYPSRIRLDDPSPPQSGVVREFLAGAPEAESWMRAERRVLLAVTAAAAELRQDVYAWQIPSCLAVFLDLAGYWQDWATMQRLALVAAKRLGNRAAQARVHLISSHACVRLGSEPDALVHLGDALCIHRELGDRRGQARTHVAFSLVLNRQGEHREAFGHAQHALVLYWSVGDRAGLAQALNAIGWSEAHFARPEHAIVCCRRALDLHRAAGNRLGETEVWDTLGYAHHQLGDYPEATACYERAVMGHRGLSSRHNEACVHVRLGDAHLASGRPELARMAWKRALDVFEEDGHPEADLVRYRIKHIDNAADGDVTQARPETVLSFKPVS